MDQKTYIAFDQYQRYQTICHVIEFYRGEDENKIFKVLEIGSNEHKDLKLFLPNDKIVFTDITLTKAMEQDPDFQRVDGTNLPYEDGSFDFVVAADVLEHVPQEERMRFCHELRRVAKIASVICFPYMTQENVDAEERLNVYYKSLYGSDFIWLKEHSTCGLPREAEIDQIYDGLNSPYLKFHHGNLETWEKMWYCHFNTCGAAITEEYRHMIDHYYNTAIYHSDIVEPCYRVFYISTKTDVKALQVWMDAKWEKSGAKEDVLDLILNRHQHMVERCEIIHETAVEPTAVATVYWAKAGQVFQETDACKWEHPISDHDLRILCELPVSSALIRFDPAEFPCVVEDLHVYSSAGALRVEPENAMEYGGKYVFLDGDPRFQITLDGKQVTSLDIRAHVTPLDYPEQEELLDQLFRVREQAAKEQRRLQEQIEVQRTEHEATLAESQAAHEAAMAESQAAHEAAMAESRAAHEAAMAESRAAHEAAMAESQAAHEAAMAEQKEAHQMELEEQAAKYQDMLEEQAEELEEQKAKLAEAEEKEEQLLTKQREIQAALELYHTHYDAAIGQREDLKRELAQAQYAYNVISNAFFWKITKPARMLADLIKRPFRKSRTFRLVGKGLRCLKENGFRYTWRKVQDKLHHRQDYLALSDRVLFTREELEAQKNHTFPQKIKFSIVVPLYNTPEQFLHEMIQSVIDQTYGDWELCMADGSDQVHSDVGRICRTYVQKDHRIKYQKLDKNMGISGNTNACLEMATGDYIGLFDHDDLLHPAALYEVMRTICETGADFVYTDELTFSEKVSNIITAHFKPDFAPDNLRANNYICHFSVFSKQVLQAAGPFRKEYDGSQDHDFVLRATEKAKKIVHIPEILYYWRSHPNSVAEDINSKTYAIDAGKRAVADHIKRLGMSAKVESSKAFPTIYRIKYDLIRKPLVSIVIPNKDHYADISKCVNTILNQSTYENYEIIIVDNGSSDQAVLDYYEELKRKRTKKKILIKSWPHPFNYSAINNYGVKFASGEQLILLNSDTKIISSNWIEEMLMYAQRKDVGAVGAKLYYEDNTIQHAGVVLGLGLHRVAGHVFYKAQKENLGYMGRLYYAQNYSAVTAACVMIPKKVWDTVGGLDEEFQVAFNDVDLCMRIRKAGYLIVWTPYAELYHYESKSRGAEDTPEKRKRFEGEVRRFQERWKKELAAGDPYYNPNLTLDREDFSLK